MAASARSNRKYCIASNCSQTSYRSASHSSYFTLPKEEQRRKEWLITLGREDLLNKKDLKIKGYLVCSAHFDEDAMKIMRQLKSDAVPNKCLPGAGAGVEGGARARGPATVDVSTQVKQKIKLWTDTISVPAASAPAPADSAAPEEPPDHQQPDLTARKRKVILKTLAETESSAKKGKIESDGNDLANDPEDDIGGRFRKLMDWHNKILQRFDGNVNDPEYKIFAMKFFISSPPAYRSLQRVLNFPSEAILNKIKVYIPPVLDDRVLNFLSLKLDSMPDEAKYCTLCVQERPLKGGAEGGAGGGEVALVALLQGVLVGWQQPVAHGFLARPPPPAALQAWLDDVITKLFSIGIEVKAIVSDQSSVFHSYAKTIKKVTIEKPYFYVGDHKIYYIFDVPYLLKCVRYSMMTCDFYYNERIISFEYIRELISDQKEKDLRELPKITDAHMTPQRARKARVRHAAQLLSGSVAAALQRGAASGALPAAARHTAALIAALDAVFDVLNARQPRAALTMADHQESALDNALDIFSKIQAISRKTRKNITIFLKWPHNFQVTIQAVKQLFEDMKGEGFPALLTRRLNAECCARVGGAVRAQVGSGAPTRTQLTMAFSKLFCNSVLREPSAAADHHYDILNNLLEAEYFMENHSTTVQ